MAIQIKFDNNYDAIEPTFELATRSGKKLGVLHAHNITVSDNAPSHGEIQFSVYKNYDGETTHLWNDIVDFKLVYCKEMDMWFEIHVEIVEDADTVKNISCISLGESELSQIILYGVEINTETDIARSDYKPTVLFDETDEDASLLNRIMEKAPHYTIKHVDASIAKIQRTFSFDKITLHDTFQSIGTEIECIFIIGSGSNEDGTIERTVSVYDLKSYCFDCKKRGNFLNECSECGSKNISTGYGEDTNIFVCAENLADGITYSTDVGSVKNCFRLEGGDDLMTATIATCNPNGSNYIWYLSDAVRADMSDELKARLIEYDALYNTYQNTRAIELDSSILSQYNAIIEKYSTYKSGLTRIPDKIVGYPALMNVYYDTIDLNLFLHDELMPSPEMSDTTARDQANLLNSTALSPVAVSDLETCSASTATNAVLAMAKIIVDKNYRVKVSEGMLNGTLWSGSFTVENYSNEDDAASTGLIQVTITDNYSEFVQQKLSKALSDSVSSNLTSISDLFNMSIGDFQAAIKRYCLASLKSFSSACQTCLDIMIEQGVANNETWVGQNPNLYSSLYYPYYQKYVALQSEMILRESEIAIISGSYDADGKLVEDGIQTIIQRENNAVHNTLHFENYIGEELWKEFISYRREDTYRNDNYISNGLSNSELFSLALDFIDKAKVEIYKSATLQHSISSTLKNLLVMEEFKPIVKHFSVGNWIRVSVDNVIYRLRLLSYEIDFDNLKQLSVVFSDVTKTTDRPSDKASILNQMASMASSYDGVMRQAEQATNNKLMLDSWVNDGLALTKMRIIDSAKDQNVTFDEHGVLCRQYLPITESYDDKQLKIINRGLYLTDDGWLTSRAGIGDFVYYNPENGQMEESYGVIADTLVGNLILSKKVGIYNMDNSIILDQKGIVITTNGENVAGDQKVFTIRRKDKDENGVELIKDLFYVDNTGNLTYSGSLKGVNGDFTGDVTALSLTISGTPVDDYVDGRAEDIVNPVRESIEDLIDTVDGETVIYYAASAPETVNDKDIWYNTSNNVIQRYVDGKWVDITYTTLGLSLRAITNAQATADGKIVTFAQPSHPTAAAVGDLWIDTDDKNKLYRWNGTKWIEYRDGTISDAQNAADAAKTEAINAKKAADAAQKSAESSKQLANSASEAAQGARRYAEAIYDGTTGIFFTSDDVNSLNLNTKDGLKIVGKDETYFQVKNTAMGFFRKDGTAMMYYDQGNLTLTGIISANGGYIGGANGWIIGENQIASKNGEMGMRVNDATWGIWAGNGKFRVQPNGYLHAENASITGAVTATTLNASNGNIAGFTLTSNSLYCGGARGSSSTSTGISTESDYAFWAGNGKFRVTQAGKLYATNAEISGTISGSIASGGSLTAGYWTFDSSGSKYSNGSISANMTVLSGDFVGGGSSERVFYGSSGCDVQYGADYDYQAIIRGGKIKFIAHYEGSMYDYDTIVIKRGASKPSGGTYNHVSIYDDDASSSTPRGNLGTANHPWDTMYARKAFYDEKGSISSSRSVKKDISTMGDYGKLLDMLEPVTYRYTWDDDNHKPRYGLIYEDTVDIMPEICEKPEDNEDRRVGIYYDYLIPILLKEVQSMRHRIAELEKTTR